MTGIPAGWTAGAVTVSMAEGARSADANERSVSRSETRTNPGKFWRITAPYGMSPDPPSSLRRDIMPSMGLPKQVISLPGRLLALPFEDLASLQETLLERVHVDVLDRGFLLHCHVRGCRRRLTDQHENRFHADRAVGDVAG